MPFLKPWKAFTPIGARPTVDVTRGESLYRHVSRHVGVCIEANFVVTGPLRSFVWLAALRRSFAKPDIGGILQQDLARQGQPPGTFPPIVALHAGHDGYQSEVDIVET